MRYKEYNRQATIEYAKKWALKRNPSYYNFDAVGGDCTSFASQCIYQGSKIMNYQKDLGWYYINGNNKSPSWSGVEYLYQFLINNKGTGPHTCNCKDRKQIYIKRNKNSFPYIWQFWQANFSLRFRKNQMDTHRKDKDLREN